MSDIDSASRRPRPMVLCILDGWGDRAEVAHNAIAQAETPNWDRYVANSPMARLEASGVHVGLPAGQMGNSEVGHMTLGAGRVVEQDLPRIDNAVADGSLAAHPNLVRLIERLRQSGGACHLIGLLSPGGVHSHQDHMVALASIVADGGIEVRVHALLDGRDTPPRSAKGFMESFLAETGQLAGLSVATVGGRYYAMDRDQRWERVEKGLDTLLDGAGKAAADPLSAIQYSYEGGVGDEFMVPACIGDYGGMKDGDGLLVANFRADRVRQILSALADPGFDAFARKRMVDFAARVGMAEYSPLLNRYFEVLFPPPELAGILGQVVAEASLTQLRLAETEKYAHVTFFLNGGREEAFAGEERILVPSPKVATYDLEPAMSALKVTDRLIEAIKGGRFDLIVVNYANGDMVGHTGVLAAAIEAVGTLDSCLGRLEAALVEAGGALLVTADHGNCELMQDAETGQPHTAHSLNRVPAVLINGPAGGLRDGRLSDVAPTLLELMGLSKPAGMTGLSLIEKDGALAAVAQ